MANFFQNLMSKAGRSRVSSRETATYGSLILDSTYSQPLAKASADWLQTYGQHPWLHATVTRIAEGVAASPWTIYTHSADGQSDKRVKSILTYRGLTGSPVKAHPAQALLNRPNPEHTGYQLRTMIQTFMELCGEAFLLIDRDTDGTPNALHPVPPHWVEDLPTSDTPFFRMRLKGSPVDVPRVDVVWFRDINPYDPYGRGLGAAQSAADEILADQYAAKQNVRFFYNGARPDIMMVLKGKMRSPLEAKRIKEQWSEQYGGLWNAHKLALVEGDVVDIKPLGTAPKDMEFSQLRKSSRDNIVGNWGMPPSMVGIVEDVNRANADTAIFLFAKWIVYPRLIGFQDTITSDLLSQYPKYPGCWLEHTDPVPENQGQRAKEMLAAFQSKQSPVTFNELRSTLGLKPDPNGDTYPTKNGWSYRPGGDSEGPQDQEDGPSNGPDLDDLNDKLTQLLADRPDEE